MQTLVILEERDGTKVALVDIEPSDYDLLKYAHGAVVGSSAKVSKKAETAVIAISLAFCKFGDDDKVEDYGCKNDLERRYLTDVLWTDIAPLSGAAPARTRSYHDARSIYRVIHCALF